MAFKALWFRGLDPKDKQALENALRTSILAERLRNIVKVWEDELPPTLSDYDSPSWSHKQAHRNGMAEVLQRLKSILTDDGRSS